MKFLLVEDIESMKKYYPNISDLNFMKFIRLDPTYNGGDNPGTYARWILGLENLGKLDNIGHVTDVLTRFEDNKKNLINKDIMKYKSVQELEDMLNDDSSYKELSHRQEVRQNLKDRKNTDLTKDAELVFETPNWEVWIPKTYAASCKLGQGTKWCTASTENDYYYDYYKENYGGNYYININKHNPQEKYQFHFESNQYMDAEDRGINIYSFLKNNPDLNSFYEPILIKRMHDILDELYIPTTHVDGENLCEALSGSYRYSVDKDFIYRILFQDDAEELFYTDWIDTDYLNGYLQQLDKDNEQRIELILLSDNIPLVDIEDDLEYAIKDNDEDSLMDIILQCGAEAYRAGAVLECLSDIEACIKLPPYITSYRINYDNGTLNCTVDKEKFYEYYIEHPDEALDEDGYEYNYLDEMILDYQERYGDTVFEPQYGWDGFDEEVFNECLRDNLPRIEQ